MTIVSLKIHEHLGVDIDTERGEMTICIVRDYMSSDYEELSDFETARLFEFMKEYLKGD